MGKTHHNTAINIYSLREFGGRLYSYNKSTTKKTKTPTFATWTQSNNLELEDFSCRFMILEDSANHLIGTVEASLIRYYKPIWNTKIDGFGNHDPGSGRYNQAKSEWDTLHPGRAWADKCVGQSSTIDKVEEKLADYFTTKSIRNDK